MKKFARVFYSQIFNSFFPVLIIAILIKLVDSHITASIFLLINFSNIYLLFSDYSSNIIFLKNALQAGGISEEKVPEKIVENIETYIGVKVIVLLAGFFFWILLCLFIPQLNKNPVSNILAYSFIIGNNINFYWLYMSSSKEYFFIISNFLGRLFFVALLLLYARLQTDFFSLMPLVGLGTIIISLVTFKKFCNTYRFGITLSYKTVPKAITQIKNDWPLVANSFLILTPSNCLSFFIGFIKNTNSILAYAFAEKIFMAIRALLGVFVNSVYPVICREGSMKTKRSKKIMLFFYLLIVIGCVITYLLSPYIFKFLKLPVALNSSFRDCIFYFLLTVIVISINTRYFLQLLITNSLNYLKNFALLLIASTIVIIVFALNIYLNNNILSIVKSLLLAETIIVLAFIILSNLTRTKIAR